MALLPTRPPRDTGPIELRDFGPAGRRLGTPADCYDGSPWELHRGELVEQIHGKDIHGIAMAIIAALFRTHARDGLTVMTDVYCELSDAQGISLRAPDVVLVGDLSTPRDEAYRGTPILAVEIRATQSKRHLEEKVELYLEHDWPWIWVLHVARQEVEVFGLEGGSVVYRAGGAVPLIDGLDKHGMTSVPASALFSQRDASRCIDGWVRSRGEASGRSHAILQVLEARGLVVPSELRARISSCTDLPTLERWLVVAATSSSIDALAHSFG